MLWLQENEPEVYKKTEKFLQSNSYLVYQLTGNYSQDYSQGDGFHFFQIATGDWEQSMAGLGAGAIRPGQAQEQGGQAWGMSIQLDTPVIHKQLILGYHVLPDQWLQNRGKAPVLF